MLGIQPQRALLFRFINIVAFWRYRGVTVAFCLQRGVTFTGTSLSVKFTGWSCFIFSTGLFFSLSLPKIDSNWPSSYDIRSSSLSLSKQLPPILLGQFIASKSASKALSSNSLSFIAGLFSLSLVVTSNGQSFNGLRFSFRFTGI